MTNSLTNKINNSQTFTMQVNICDVSYAYKYIFCLYEVTPK